MALISAWVLLGFFGGRVNQNERLRKLLSWHRLSASWCSLFKSPQRITLLKVFLLCCIRIHHWTAKKLLLVFVVSCKVLQIGLNSYSPSLGCPTRQLRTLKDITRKSMQKQLVSVSETQIVCVGTVVIYPQLQWWEPFSLFIHQVSGLPPSCLSVPAPVYTLLLSAAQTQLSRANPFQTPMSPSISVWFHAPPLSSLLLLSVPVCVCLRLADRHAGPAAGGSSPHPALLPRGNHLAVLQLQESLLQTGGCHALLCRCGNNFLKFLIRIIITVSLSGRF